MVSTDGSMNRTYDLYLDLELRPPCTIEEITRAYKKLALKFHPDKATGSTEKFQKIKRAYDVLKDPLKKKLYDKFGDSFLNVISPDESESNIFAGTSSFLGRMIFKILLRPTLLVPIFLALASIGIIFIMFLNRLDQKLYFSQYQATPWYYIFSLLWVLVAVSLILQGLYLYFILKMARTFADRLFESEEYQSIPAPRKRFLKIVHAIKSIIFAFQVFFGILLFLYCTISLAFNMTGEGKLLNGLTWSKLFLPVVLFFISFGIVKNILCFSKVLQFNHPSRMWKQRILVISYELFATISSIAFFKYFGKWLDSSDKNQVNLFLIFTLIYLRILFHGFRIRCESNWAAEDEIKKFLQSNPSNNPQEEIEKNLKRYRKTLGISIYTLVIVLGISIGLVHSHIACGWPKTWSGAFSPLLFCVYTSIAVFGCCCPCIVFCMELTLPPNSFHSFRPAATGEEQVTIIEISSFYRFGYGFAPIQGRITYPLR
jgi:hypothetical protein